MKTALLLSGGMDSLSIAWWKRPHVAITVDYGQLPAAAEEAASSVVCQRLGIEHHHLRVDCSALGSGDLVGTVPDAAAPASDWWPYRNQLLVTLAAMRAVTLGVDLLWLGTVRTDEGHRDGTSEFIERISALLCMQEGGMRVEAPAIGYTTIELVKVSKVPLNFLAWAHSCHKANVACGACRGCNKHRDVWNALDR